MDNNQDILNILLKIDKKPQFSQRQLARELGFSIGKLHYCLKSLQSKGLVKIRNFQNKKNKIEYFKKYILTQDGILERTRLTVSFMRRKMYEYDQLKKELKRINNSKIIN